MKAAQKFKQVYARYQQARDLISVGAYVPGSDPETDFAIERIDIMKAFLQQGLQGSSPYPESVEQLIQVMNMPSPNGQAIQPGSA